METKEIIVNEDVMNEMTDVVVDAGSNGGIKPAVVIGVAALVGGAIALGYKYVAKPIIAKVKAKKEQAAAAEVCEESEVYDVE